jgi:5-methylcytosine-specific restriction endonuclease McrA
MAAAAAIAVRQNAKRTARAKATGRARWGWRETRRRVLRRDDNHCTRCGASGEEAVLTAHRIGGGWHDADLDQYVTLCQRCHGSVDGGKQ